VRDGNRARELLPSVLLTLLSVVQALALETLWSSARESPFLLAGDLLAWTGWLHALAVFQGIVVIWLFYISTVMRFSWVPSTRDSVAPFVLGALELSMIQLIEPSLLPYWYYTLALTFALSTWVSNSMFRAGLHDAANAGILEMLPQASRFDSLAPPIFVAAIAGLGIAVHVAGVGGVTALICAGLANALLLLQAWVIQSYWRQWVGSA
jgi:hypothetical protein